MVYELIRGGIGRRYRGPPGDVIARVEFREPHVLFDREARGAPAPWDPPKTVIHLRDDGTAVDEDLDQLFEAAADDNTRWDLLEQVRYLLPGEATELFYNGTGQMGPRVLARIS